PSAYETAIAKAACNQAGFEAASEAVQIMGAMGYSQESLVEWCMRRCRGWMIAGGSIEILKNRIAEHVFDRRFDQRGPKPAAAAGGFGRWRLRSLPARIFGRRGSPRPPPASSLTRRPPA